MNRLLQKYWFWGILIIGGVMLTLVPLFREADITPLMLGLPTWYWYLVGIHLLIVGILYLFGKYMIQEEEL